MTASIDTTTGDRKGATTIAVTSGKGGVGKTSVVINLAVALARLRHRVAILDADFGLGNVDVLLGLAPAYHLGHMLAGEREIEDILVDGPFGVKIIPASSGLRDLTALTEAQWLRLADGLQRLCLNLDYLLIDTAAGLSDNVVQLLISAQRVLVVTSLEPSAMVDAYAMVKVLTLADATKDIAILVNGARDADEGELVYRQLDVAATRFLNRGLRYYGYVPYDPAVREAVLVQRPIVDHRPQSPASRCFRVLASRIANLGPSGGPGLRLVPPGVKATAGSGGVEVQRCA
ncbi:MAG TPA: MinD/ParA family protein [Vicinamibacterales bacterium]|jgi:flagellar biosynthesis protein FlhG